MMSVAPGNNAPRREATGTATEIQINRALRKAAVGNLVVNTALADAPSARAVSDRAAVGEVVVVALRQPAPQRNASRREGWELT